MENLLYIAKNNIMHNKNLYNSFKIALISCIVIITVLFSMINGVTQLILSYYDSHTDRTVVIIPACTTEVGYKSLEFNKSIMDEIVNNRIINNYAIQYRVPNLNITMFERNPGEYTSAESYGFYEIYNKSINQDAFVWGRPLRENDINSIIISKDHFEYRDDGDISLIEAGLTNFPKLGSDFLLSYDDLYNKKFSLHYKDGDQSEIIDINIVGVFDYDRFNDFGFSQGVYISNNLLNKLYVQEARPSNLSMMPQVYIYFDNFDDLSAAYYFFIEEYEYIINTQYEQVQKYRNLSNDIKNISIVLAFLFLLSAFINLYNTNKLKYQEMLQLLCVLNLQGFSYRKIRIISLIEYTIVYLRTIFIGIFISFTVILLFNRLVRGYVNNIITNNFIFSYNLLNSFIIIMVIYLLSLPFIYISVKDVTKKEILKILNKGEN